MSNLLSLFSGARYGDYIKRALDIFLSILFIIIFLPICLVAAIFIKLDSKGPVFADVPERVGQNGKKFRMYKFRSMIINAHNLLRTDPQFKTLFEEFSEGI